MKKTSDGKWQARWRDETGRQRAKRFRTKAEAEAHQAMMRTKVRRGEATVNASMTVAELAEDWKASWLHLAPNSVKTYRRDLDRYILPEFGHMQIGKVKAPMIQDWLAEELERFAPSSVHRHYRTLRTLFGFAVKRDLLVKNPCQSVTAPRVAKTRLEVLTVKQIEDIASAILPRYRCFVLVAAYGGLRFSEIVGLRRMDIKGAQITIAGQLQRIDGEWVRSEAKTTSSHRTITVPPTVAIELAEHLEQFTGPSPEDLVFTNSEGRPVGHSFRHNVWAPACVKAGLGTRTIKNHVPAYRDIPRLHDLRHTAASLAIAAGAHVKTIQQRLGHSSVTVTMDRYGHLMAGVDEQLADDLDRMRGE